MNIYVKSSTTVSNGHIVDTPYCTYEFDNLEDAQDFCDYINQFQASKYNDERIGMVLEHCYFLNREGEFRVS